MALAQPQFVVGRRKVSVDLPHLAFATAIGAWIAWFCRDAWRSQPDVENMILILPASILALVIYAFVALGCFKVSAVDAASAAPEAREGRGSVDRKTAIRIFGSMVVLGAYVVTGPMFGFDVASFVYMAVMMALLGERRILPLVLIPLMFCALVIYGFNTLLSTPLPMVFFHSD